MSDKIVRVKAEILGSIYDDLLYVASALRGLEKALLEEVIDAEEAYHLMRFQTAEINRIAEVAEAAVRETREAEAAEEAEVTASE